ncbi:hypothetical protein MBM_02514 [Drepanopeziza brunnea f. sp. 'multigermtubi' MB_m1]|uniref:Uncharacterized protein n=1 Tax=Marssonina brunnea f. sp. multigermtubi (strain MB_m1) TaxID=1072389 RepID=K1X2N8_MARBU|nr:uncharacterized protein MBM_02514 [Drepanopeziza brunnea f. sp. 'multigermtubi' MB_m1]EKD19277.1 hypothetical protein MBM_02514 [Drepanopeziza brunnea f. sp. 'multigermtubi' MB_m1]
MVPLKSQAATPSPAFQPAGFPGGHLPRSPHRPATVPGTSGRALRIGGSLVWSVTIEISWYQYGGVLAIGVDGEGDCIDVLVADCYLTAPVHEYELYQADPREVLGERVVPEVILSRQPPGSRTRDTLMSWVFFSGDGLAPCGGVGVTGDVRSDLGRYWCLRVSRYMSKPALGSDPWIRLYGVRSTVPNIAEEPQPTNWRMS